MDFDFETMSDEEINELVDHLMNGADGNERVIAQAAAAAKVCADRGNAMAQYRYGTFLASGNGVDKDDAAAGEYWRKSAAQGYPEANNRLGMCALYGISGEEKNPERAAVYFRSAAEAGLPDAMFNMCMLYDTGTGVAKDSKKAYEYMKLAADNNHPAACTMLGLRMAFAGTSSAEEREKGASYILTAAESGNTEAQMLYGMCCENGTGVEKDLAKACGWYRRAAKAGNAAANQALARLGFPGVN